MNIATLGLEVQSDGVNKGTQELEKFTNAAKKAEAAVNGLSSAKNASKVALDAAKATYAQSNAALAAAKASETASQADVAAARSARDRAQAAMLAARADYESQSAALSNAKALLAEANAAVTAQKAMLAHANAANQNARVSNVASHNVANLAAQFQDIGVSAAMGMAPLQVALQQGTQIASVLGPMGAGGAVRGLGAAFLSVISPVSLMTIALVGATTAAIQYFSEWLSSGKSANLTVAEQSRLVQQVAQDWGDATPKLAAYAAELERIKKASDRSAAGEIAAQAQFKPIEDVLGVINRQYADAIRNLRDYGGETTSVVQKLTTSFSELQTQVMAGKATTGDLKAVQDALNVALDSYGTPAVHRLADAFSELVPRINAAIQAAAGYRSEVSDLTRTGLFPSRGAYGNIERTADGPIQGNGTILPDVGPRPSSRPLIELDGLPGEFSSRKSRGEDAYISATKSVGDQTRALQAQTAAQAGLNPLVSDYGYAVAKAKVETDLLLAAEKEKKAITPELLTQIGTLASGYASATAEQNRLTESTRKAQEAMSFVKNTTAGFVNDLRNGLRDGEGFWRSFGNAALNVLDRITDKLLGDVLDSVLKVSGAGGKGGGILDLFGGIFGGGKSAIDPWEGLRGYATGTSSARPGVAWVGEKGPELVRFKGGEEVIPNHRLSGVSPMRAPANQNQTTRFEFHSKISVSGNGDKELMERLHLATEQQMQAGFDEFSRSVLPGRVSEINNDPYAVG